MFENELVRAVRRRKRSRKTAAIVSAVSAIGITIFLIIAFCMITINKFTISIENEPTLCLTIDENKEDITTILNAPPLQRATDTQYSDIPENIDDGLGSKNTYYYFAYSFYLGCRSTDLSLNYSMTMELSDVSNEIENAIKVMIIRNGVRRIYAKANEDGSAKLLYSGYDHDEPSEIIGSTIPFKDNKHIILEPYKINPDEYDRFTIVMWIDGWESHNDMRGGIFQAKMEFSTMTTNNG